MPLRKVRPRICSAPTRRCSISALSSSGAVGPSPTGKPRRMAKKTFTVGWLYPDLMNIYGDRGNVLTLLKRASWRGMQARVLDLGKGVTWGIEEVDVFFFGGGQDKEQALVYDNLLESKAVPLAEALHRGAAVLAVCGGYQLLGHYYQTAEGERFNGLGLLDAYTEAGPKRCIGDVVVEADPELGLTPPTL